MQKEKYTKKKSSVAYRGDVVVSLMRGNKVYKTIKSHNEGGYPLFNFLANCLIGNFSNVDQPRNIRVGNLSDDTFTSSVVSAIPYSNVRIEQTEQSSATVVYTFIIPFADIVIDDSINCIRLYSSRYSGKDAVANYSASFVPDKPVTLDRDSNLKIEWYMTINNLDEGE